MQDVRVNQGRRNWANLLTVSAVEHSRIFGPCLLQIGIDSMNGYNSMLAESSLDSKASKAKQLSGLDITTLYEGACPRQLEICYPKCPSPDTSIFRDPL